MPDFDSLASYKSLDEVLTQSEYDGDAKAIYDAVAKDFNTVDSIMTTGYQAIFKHRRIKPSEYRLVHRNNIPELVVYNPTPQRRIKNLDPFVSSSTLGIFDQNQPLIGAFGHYVVTVPIGQYAKIIDNNQAKLLGPGKHVIHSNNFQFEPRRDLVNQNTDVITHKDITVLRVPPGKVAAVMVDNQPFILESRETPYVFKTQQFSLSAPEGQHFYDANSKSITVGSKKRLLPDLNEVAVINRHGKAHFYPDESEHKSEEAGPIYINDPNARFDGFMSTNFENLEFPSKETRIKRREEGRQDLTQYYDKFYTADRVEVGVKFFVCYQIEDPKKVLAHLNLKDIQTHIEGVVNTDMGRAIQRTSSQHLLSSDLSKTRPPMDYQSGDGLAPPITEEHTFWQDAVKTKLTEDLAEYGIKLVRLNIEEAKILNSDLENQMAEQAKTVAQAEAKLAALETITTVQQKEAQLAQTVKLKEQETSAKLMRQKAEAELSAAEINARRTQVDSEAEARATKVKGEVLGSSPEMFQLQMAEQFAAAVQKGNFSSTMPLSDLWQAFLSLLNMGPDKKRIQEEKPSQAEMIAKSSPLITSGTTQVRDQVLQSELLDLKRSTVQ